MNIVNTPSSNLCISSTMAHCYSVLSLERKPPDMASERVVHVKNYVKRLEANRSQTAGITNQAF